MKTKLIALFTVLFVCLFVVMLSASGVVVTTKDDPPAVSGTWETGIKTGYLASVGLMIHRGMVTETELKLHFGDTGLYAGVWVDVPFDKKSPAAPEQESKPLEITDPTLAGVSSIIGSLGKIKNTLKPPKVAPASIPYEGEVDLYVGYRLKLGDWAIDSSLLFFNFNELEELNDDQWVTQSTLSYNGWKRTVPWLTANYYAKTGSLSPPDSLYLYAGIDQAIKLFGRNDGSEQAINVGVSTAVSDGKLLGIDSGFVYARAKASTDIKLWKDAYLTPSVMYQRKLADGEFAKRDEVVGGLAFRWEFKSGGN